MVAALNRRFGDLDLAEEAAAEAFATAVERWPADGIPPNPGAWLTTTANRKAIDRIRLIFTCCHPALAMQTRVALTLRMVGGLTVDQMLLCTLPGYTEGPRRLNGALDGPLDDRLAAREAYGQAAEDAPAGERAEPSALPLGLETFARIFGDWVAAYNTGHAHSELGCTPEHAWQADPTPVQDVPGEQLRHLLLAGEPRTIGPHGIRFRNLHWVDAGGLIRERCGQRVQIRYMPHDDRQIHVYLEGEFLATCLPRDALSPEQEEEFYAAARAQEKQAAAQRSAARKRGRRRLATLSADSVATDSVRRVSPAEADRQAAASPPPPDLRREASTSLLGLRPIGPIGPIEPVDLAAMDVREKGRPW
ncbi:Mu transposase C-terminal domain-containing protein [Nonomuraea zeae]|uniref:Mu transposase C-terminal domain-containing protein n=1 Tax=Nonomuraea zeae TaxID=1642303 RepID=UPI0019820D81|nr:Mu transposase C-terminal domain-containing protein [Nonomuraea zeae]